MERDRQECSDAAGKFIPIVCDIPVPDPFACAFKREVQAFTGDPQPVLRLFQFRDIAQHDLDGRLLFPGGPSRSQLHVDRRTAKPAEYQINRRESFAFPRQEALRAFNDKVRCSSSRKSYMDRPMISSGKPVPRMRAAARLA